MDKAVSVKTYARGETLMPCTQRGLWEKGMPNEGRSPQQGLDMGGQQQSYGLVQSFTALLKTIHQGGRHEIALIQDDERQPILPAF